MANKIVRLTYFFRAAIIGVEVIAMSEKVKRTKISDKFEFEIQKSSDEERQRMAELATLFTNKMEAIEPEEEERVIKSKFVIEKKLDSLSSIAEGFERFRRYNRGKGVSDETVRYYETNYKRLTSFITFNILSLEEYKKLSYEEMEVYGCRYPMVVMENSDFEEKYREYLKEVAELKPQTVLNAMRAYRAFYYFCSRENKWIREKKIKIAAEEANIKPLFTEEQLDKLLIKPKVLECSFCEYRNWVIINYAYNTGNRRSSICGIQMKDLGEIEEGYISIQVQKNKKPKRLYVPSKVVSILKEYIRYYRDDAASEDYLFCSDRGEQLTPNALSKSIEWYMRSRLGDDTPPQIGLHMLRHQFAAEYMKGESANIFDLQKQLGHDTLYMTKYYADKYGNPNGSNLELHAPINKRKSKKGYSKIKIKVDDKK